MPRHSRDLKPLFRRHKKARLQLQPGFFRDPVGIRTPNLRIRSAMLYPVELQSHFLRRNGGQRYQLVLNRQTVGDNSLSPRAINGPSLSAIPLEARLRAA